MRPGTLRPGLTLIEIIVSLALLLVLLSVGSLVARRSIQVLLTVSATELRSGTLSDALRTLTRHLRNADPAAHDLRVARDSVLDLVHTIGAATLCRVSRDTIVLAAPNDALPWSSTLPRWVTTDDAVRVWHDSDARWIERDVRSILNRRRCHARGRLLCALSQILRHLRKARSFDHERGAGKSGRGAILDCFSDHLLKLRRKAGRWRRHESRRRRAERRGHHRASALLRAHLGCLHAK